MPCEENPEWYAQGPDASRTEAFLASEGIEARVTFVDRGAVCRACMPACAASYLVAEVAEADVNDMAALGWTSNHPFPDEPDEPTRAPDEYEGTSFTYTPMQCEPVPWSGASFASQIADRYAAYGITVSGVTRHELDVMVCEACYVCPTNIEYRLTLVDGSPDELVRDGWSGGPSCEEIGCAPGRTCSGDACVYDGLAVE